VRVATPATKRRSSGEPAYGQEDHGEEEGGQAGLCGDPALGAGQEQLHSAPVLPGPPKGGESVPTAGAGRLRSR
jgi:hypothetical protein